MVRSPVACSLRTSYTEAKLLRNNDQQKTLHPPAPETHAYAADWFEFRWQGFISKRRIGVGTWMTIDMTPLMNGNGVFNTALAATNTTALRLTSRESGADAPQLMMEMLP